MALAVLADGAWLDSNPCYSGLEQDRRAFWLLPGGRGSPSRLPPCPAWKQSCRVIKSVDFEIYQSGFVRAVSNRNSTWTGFGSKAVYGFMNSESRGSRAVRLGSGSHCPVPHLASLPPCFGLIPGLAAVRCAQRAGSHRRTRHLEAFTLGRTEPQEASRRRFLISLWPVWGYLLILEAISDAGGMLNVW